MSNKQIKNCKKENRKKENMVLSYRAIRRAVGALGVLLPLIPSYSRRGRKIDVIPQIL